MPLDAGVPGSGIQSAVFPPNVSLGLSPTGYVWPSTFINTRAFFAATAPAYGVRALRGRTGRRVRQEAFCRASERAFPLYEEEQRGVLLTVDANPHAPVLYPSARSHPPQAGYAFEVRNDFFGSVFINSLIVQVDDYFYNVRTCFVSHSAVVPAVSLVLANTAV